jgi:hypothetical protein
MFRKCAPAARYRELSGLPWPPVTAYLPEKNQPFGMMLGGLFH